MKEPTTISLKKASMPEHIWRRLVALLQDERKKYGITTYSQALLRLLCELTPPEEHDNANTPS
jgi:hypothetical protein